MFPEGRFPDRWLNFGTEPCHEFGVLFRSQVYAACDQVDLRVFSGNQDVINPFCIRFAAQTLSNKVVDVVIINVHAVSHRRLPCLGLHVLYKHSSRFFPLCNYQFLFWIDGFCLNQVSFSDDLNTRRLPLILISG